MEPVSFLFGMFCGFLLTLFMLLLMAPSPSNPPVKEKEKEKDPADYWKPDGWSLTEWTPED